MRQKIQLLTLSVLKIYLPTRNIAGLAFVIKLKKEDGMWLGADNLSRDNSNEYHIINYFKYLVNYIRKDLSKYKQQVNQSTSSILLAVAWEVVSFPLFSRLGSSSSILSSSIERPNLIILWILPAKDEGSSREKPEANKAVSKRSQIRSLTVLSLLSFSDFFLSSETIGWSGLIYIVFLETI